MILRDINLSISTIGPRRFLGLAPVVVGLILFAHNGLAQDLTSESATAAVSVDACAKQTESLNAALSTFTSGIEGAAEKASSEEEANVKPHLSAGLRVEMKEKSLSIPIVTLSLLRRSISMKIPEVTAKERKLSFDVPGIRMETRVIMGKPELVCRWKYGVPKCKYRSKPIKIDVPVFFSTRREISTKIPEVSMKNVTASYFAPSATVTMKRATFKLPEVKSECWQLNNPEACNEAEVRRMEQAATESQRRMESAIGAAQGTGAKAAHKPVQEFFECQRSAAIEPHKATMAVFTTSIAQLEATVALLKANGASSTEEARQLEDALSQLRKEAEQAAANHAATIAELAADEAAVLTALNAATENIPVENRP